MRIGRRIKIVMILGMMILLCGCNSGSKQSVTTTSQTVNEIDTVSESEESSIDESTTSQTVSVKEEESSDEEETEVEVSEELPAFSEEERLLWEKVIARLYYVTYNKYEGKSTDRLSLTEKDSDTILYLLQLLVNDGLVEVPVESYDMQAGRIIAKSDAEQLILNLLNINISEYADSEYLKDDLYAFSPGDYGEEWPGIFLTDINTQADGGMEIKGYAGLMTDSANPEEEGVVYNPENESYMKAQPFTVHLIKSKVQTYTRFSLKDFRWE